MEQQNNENYFAIAALVCGIVAIVCVFLGLYGNIVGIIVGVIGLICAIKSRKIQAKKGISTAGLIVSIVGLSLCPLFLIWNIVVYQTTKEVKDGLTELGEKLNDTLNSDEIKNTLDTLEDEAEKLIDKVTDEKVQTNAEDLSNPFEDAFNDLEESTEDLFESFN